MTKWLAALAALLALLGVVLVRRELRRPYRGYSGSLIVVIDPGTRAADVASLLVARGALARRWPFLFRYALGRLRHRRLKAGEYLFDRPLRPLDVYRKLVQGEVFFHPIVIPEGSDRFDIARILEQQLGVDSPEFLAVTERTSPIHDLDPQAPTLEGYLFPDTYLFARGVSSTTVVTAMLTRFRRVIVSRLGEEMLQSRLGLHGTVTLASLVEKETPEPTERPIVAEVFLKRLERHWLLQCDPTVVYAVRVARRASEDPIESPRGPITRSNLEFDSPYNTYRHSGLPPGPIASPGEASVRAALHPAASDFYYFVSNNHGGHTFARTLAEHQRNVARYRRELAEFRGVAPVARAQSRPRTRPRSTATNGHPTKSDKRSQQKAKNRGVLPGSGLRARRTARDPSH